MSIPKLKVYRLETDFNEANDTDVQTQSKDELLPIAEKELNPLTSVEEMVGVKLRGDCRIVYRENVHYRYVDFDPEDNMKTVPVPCEGWIMGKANIEVSVLDKTDTDGTTWYTLDKRLWDYDVTEVKQYLVNGSYQDTMDASATGIYNISHITIRFGAMMENTSIAKSDNVFDYLPAWNDEHNKVRISYYPYREIDTSYDISDPVYLSAPFSNIYNGNREGRTIHYTTDGLQVQSGRSVPDGATIVRTRKNWYEGNYMYRRRIFPLRIKSVSLLNGSGTLDVTFNWYVDGMMAPVFMQQVPVFLDDGLSSSSSGSSESESSSEPARWVWKKLEESTQFTKVYNASGQNPNYTITMNRSYYRLSGDQYCYPSSMCVFYNFTDDDMGEPFDFDFDYDHNEVVNVSDTLSSDIDKHIYGVYYNASNHSNSGALHNDQIDELGWNGLRQEFLAVRNDYGYDASRGDALLENGIGNNTVQFTMPQAFTRNGESGYTVSSYHPIRIYHDGNLVCEIPPQFLPLDASSSSESSSSAPGYSVEMTGDVVTVTHPSDVTINDLMVACIVQTDLPYGYRIPCYEKVKKSTLFVSSYPNWLKGHLNNDLDVFVGYQQYSGVNTADEQIDSIYPKYVKDGWHPMYTDGALQFSEPVEEYDYYDIFNFGVQAESVAISSNSQNDIWGEVGSKLLPNYCPTDGSLGNYRIYCSKVMYNVAHYDGLYQVVRGRMSNISVQGGQSTYKLLTDDAFSEAVGRRWTYRHDSYIRRMYTAGQEELPRILDSSENGRERPPSMTSLMVNSEDATLIRANLSSDRVMCIRYVLSGNLDNPVQNGLVICLNPSSAAFGKIESLINGDVRIHARTNGNVLEVGAETSTLVDPSQVFEQNVDWLPLLDRPDEIIPAISASVDLDAIQDAGNDGHGGRYRYAYTGFPEFDVCFEPFSYHYTITDRPENRQVRSVEFMVYRVSKS